MASGYTHEVAERDDMTFEQFAWRCARVFGPLVHMRDDPPEAKIELDPTSSSASSAVCSKTQEEISKYEAMSPQEAERGAAVHYKRSYKEWEERRAYDVAKKKRYETMLAKVEAWDLPKQDPAYIPMKTFMVDQLRDSIDFDCHESEAPRRLTGEEWRELNLQIQRDILVFEKRMRDEKVKVLERTKKWLRGLRDSLGDPPPGYGA